MIEGVVDVLWGPEPIVAVQQFFGAAWHWFFAMVTNLGDTEMALVIASVLLWWTGRRQTYALIGIVVLVALVNTSIKDLVDLPRPHDPAVIQWEVVDRSSFPSGHSAVAGALWGGLAALGHMPAAVAAPIIVAVMVSRLYLGVHYLGDVLAGALLGVGLAAGFARLWPAVVGWFSGRPFPFYLGSAAGIAALSLGIVETASLGWEYASLVVGAVTGQVIEYRFIGYEPGWGPLLREMLKGALGLGGLLVILIGRYVFTSPIPDAVLPGLAAVWIVLVAPALFSYLGLSRRPASREVLADPGDA